MVLSWILAGLIVGAVAKLLLTKLDVLILLLLGCAGGFIGGFLASLLLPDTKNGISGLAGSVILAAILTCLYWSMESDKIRS